ncbi:protein-disulfide reductase DsbD family protein [Flagellimonas ochracea]|uniref:protein-disulfide reductase DsbD family protein n=1 Tax=Flagellimonas ochracea TaxID=2696472 RepID=UPI001AA14F8F|nr:protein-disulfide reductase DsbD family protein [Allomuricauda ochracea]
MKYIIVSIFTLLSLQVNSQLLDPADWEFSSVTAKVGETQEIKLQVILDDSWYIYSNDQDTDLGPRPTEVIFERHSSYELLGELRPIKVKEKYDDIWEGNIRYIDESGGGFVQKIKILQDNPVIRGTIVYSACSMVTGQCVFPEEEFKIKVLNP